MSKSRLIGVVFAVAVLAWICIQPEGARTVSRVRVDELPTDLEIFASVFWEPGDTESLRQLIHDSPGLVRDKSVLDIGTGSGLVALCCRQYGAREVTATDVNPNAVACAKHNARRLGLPLTVRQVPLDSSGNASAYAIFGAGERFDVVISNPPWEDGKPKQWSDFALYDPDFRLLESIIADAKAHLNPGGKVLLAYGCVEAIQAIHRLAAEHHFDVIVLDERELDSLPPVFLPGMLLGLSPQEEL